MTDRDNLYIAGLLHDIGKFIERGKVDEFKESAKKYLKAGQASQDYAHKRYSAALIDRFKSKDFLNEAIETLSLWHHRGNDNTKEDYEPISNKGILLKLLRIADDSSSSERKKDKDLEPVKYNLARILSPFQDVMKNANDNKQRYYIKTDKLKLVDIFPEKEDQSKGNEYNVIVEDFVREFTNINDEESLLFLMEKYLANIPAQTPVEINGEKILNSPDINLYDHSRVTAAIAICLYDELEKGSWKGKEKSILEDKYKELEKPCILINGNMNGIQKFIFDINSEKAAKKLKGRSYFVQILTDITAKFIIDKYNLKQANILYNGGGNFFILAPRYILNGFKQNVEEPITRVLINHELDISFGITEVGLNDFIKFGIKFKEATENTGISKYKKYKGIEHDIIFSPENLYRKENQDFEKLTESLQRTISYFYGTYDDTKEHPNWEKAINELGYKVDFLSDKSGISTETINYNELEFAKDFKGFRFAVKDLPKWSRALTEKFEQVTERERIEPISEEEKQGSIISFQRFANFAKTESGTNKIGILKMDVDNLGKIFSSGLAEEMQSISRISNLSRSFKFFFEGYINSIIREEDYKNSIYVIFSGGDDFFVTGAWNKVFGFAERVYKDFRRYTCNNKNITLSGALIVQDAGYPVYRFAQMAESRLHTAKMNEGKDSISVFDIVLKWEDFFKARELKDKIKEVIELTGENRAIISKINKSVTGYSKIQDEAGKGKLEVQKVWRLSYYLRDALHGKNKSKEEQKAKEIIDNEIIKLYEKLTYDALTGKSTNINIFPVAARWAELETKNNNKKGD